MSKINATLHVEGGLNPTKVMADSVLCYFKEWRRVQKLAVDKPWIHEQSTVAIEEKIQNICPPHSLVIDKDDTQCHRPQNLGFLIVHINHKGTFITQRKSVSIKGSSCIGQTILRPWSTTCIKWTWFGVTQSQKMCSWTFNEEYQKHQIPAPNYFDWSF